MSAAQNGKIPLSSTEQPHWLEKRLQDLHYEFKQGEAQLAELDRQRAQLRDTLLRISGAIQVLEELQMAEERDISLSAPGGKGTPQPAMVAG
jgi:prefoldin subunit 5